MGETERMNVVNEVEVDNVGKICVLGMIEKERVNGKEDMKSVVLSDIENEGGKKEGFVQLKGMSVKSAQEVTLAAAVKPVIDVRIETKQADTAEIKNKPEQKPEPEAKMDLNGELEREGIKRLAEIERLAEKERQEKIRRREELDRVARLQCILALVGAPELDSVAKMEQMADLERVGMIPGEEMADFKEMDVVTEINPVLKLGKVKVKDATEFQQVAEHKAVGEGGMLAKKKQMTESEGLEKLERMSKLERIAEIDRLLNLELEAESKRKAEIDRIAELERLAELERVAKMNRLTKIDLSAEIEKAEKERLEETKRREEIIRKEELERFAKLQRILAMVLATESDQAEEAEAASFERVKEMKHRDELKLLRELGILPKEEVNETEIGKMVKPKEGETLVVTLAVEAGANPMEEVKPMTKLKDVNSGKVVKPITDVNQPKVIKQTEIKSGVVVEADREGKIKRASELENKAKADREARIKEREELVRVANLQRVVAMVRNEEFDRLTEIKKDELERIAEKKRREDMKVLEELGLVSKYQLPQEMDTSSAVGEKDNSIEITSVEDVNTEVGFKTATEMEPAQMHPNIEVERKPDRVTEQMAEDERIVKRDVESHLMELRVAQMRRVAELGREMKMDAVAEQEQHRGIKHFTDSERTNKEESESEHMTIDHTKTEVAEMSVEKELKPLAESRLSELKQAAVESKMKGVEVGVESETKRVEDSKSANFEMPTMNRGLESGTEMERKEESKRGLEMKHQTGSELNELKRLREMKRLAGIERVRRRDCEWDGQMMYVGKA